MKHKRLVTMLIVLPLLAASHSPEILTFHTDAPALLEDSYGYLDLLSESEYRTVMQNHLEEKGFVPLGSDPTELSEKARFDEALLLDRTVTLAIDGDERRGYSLIVDLNANGSLKDDPVWPLKAGIIRLTDFQGRSQPKEVSLAEVSATLSESEGGNPVSVPFRMAVAIPQESSRGRGAESGVTQALFTQSTFRKGTISLKGQQIAFGLRGEAGIYDYSYDCVVFDLDGDGKLDPTQRTSPEFYWVWEKTVKLAGKSYDFQVDRFGESVTLTPAEKRAPERPNLGAGQYAPDFQFHDLEGNKHRLKDYRGKVVLLDFWGMWCPACAVHARELSAAYAALHDKGFEILGIHGGGSVEEIRPFLAQHDMTWPQTLDAGSEPEWRPIQRLYRVLGAPNYFLVDRKGEIVLSEEHQPAPILREAERLLSPSP